MATILSFFRKVLNLLEHTDVSYMLLVMVQEELEKLEELQDEREWCNQPRPHRLDLVIVFHLILTILHMQPGNQGVRVWTVGLIRRVRLVHLF